MNKLTSPRFGTTPLMQKPLQLLSHNASVVLKDYAYGKIHNLGSFKNNAFILSSLIQVVSRIYVANSSAQKAKGTSDAAYRYKEAVKTTFREALGFTFSYLVLRAFQRVTVDFFRNYLWVSAGLVSAPTVLNGLFRKGLFKNPFKPLVSQMDHFPSLVQSIKRLASSVSKGEKLSMKPLQSIIEDLPEDAGVVFDTVNRQAQYKRIEPLVNGITKFLARKDPSALTPEKKLQIFFDWLPPIVGSIPAILLSGFWLENFSQTKAEGIAKKTAGFFQALSGQKANSALTQPDPEPRIEEPLSTVPVMAPSESTSMNPLTTTPIHFEKTAPLDSTATIPYAVTPPVQPVSAGYPAYGYNSWFRLPQNVATWIPPGVVGN